MPDFTPPYIYDGLFEDEERQREDDARAAQANSLLRELSHQQLSVGRVQPSLADAYQSMVQARRPYYKRTIVQELIGGAIAVAPRKQRF